MSVAGPGDVKKRKACNACTKAKAKCTPHNDAADICERCHRLNKDCVYGDSLRKRGPRTRSRMKQLEQRVESLMDILVAKAQEADKASETTAPNTPTLQEHSEDARSALDQPPMNHLELPPETSNTANYDPVEAGLLTEGDASDLLSDFRQNHTGVFPFVLVDVNTDAAALRRQQPFLFLAIMGAMSHKKPSTQKLLGDAFREQIATRVVGQSTKSLEILQGLLVHTAYYHFFYRPGKQQLSLMVQLCVAMAQDYGLSKKWRSNQRCCSFEQSKAGQRALLGTYYLAAAFAHAWRKRTTMPYTRAFARACQTFSQDPEHPSDILIAPLIHSSELMCRINDYYSYDEIHDSEIHGETMIELSTNNFTAELQRLRDATPKVARNNLSIRLALDMLDVLIHECSYHSTFWRTTSLPETITPMRARMIQRSIKASQTLFNALLEAPSSSLHLLGLSSWSNWFYSTLLVIKIVIFQRTGSNGSSCVHNTPHAIDDVIPTEFGESATAAVCNMTTSFSHASLRDKPVTPEEAWLVSMFEAFLDKLHSAIPAINEEDTPGAPKAFLRQVAVLQRGFLSGLKKVTEQAREGNQGSLSGLVSGEGQQLAEVAQNERHQDAMGSTWLGEHGEYLAQNSGQWPAGEEGSGGLGLHNPALNDYGNLGDPMDDFIWNMVIDDGNNMFAW